MTTCAFHTLRPAITSLARKRIEPGAIVIRLSTRSTRSPVAAVRGPPAELGTFPHSPGGPRRVGNGAQDRRDSQPVPSSDPSSTSTTSRSCQPAAICVVEQGALTVSGSVAAALNAGITTDRDGRSPSRIAEIAPERNFDFSHLDPTAGTTPWTPRSARFSSCSRRNQSYVDRIPRSRSYFGVPSRGFSASRRRAPFEASRQASTGRTRVPRGIDHVANLLGQLSDRRSTPVPTLMCASSL